MSVARSASMTYASDSSEEPLRRKKDHLLLPEFYKIIIPDTDIAFDSIRLNGDAQRTARLYCGYTNTKRIEVYKNNHPRHVKQIKKTTTIQIVKHQKIKNTKVMTLCVGLLGGIGSLGWIAGPVGGIPGTALGVSSGLALGMLLVNDKIKKKIKVQISISDHFCQWRAEAILNKVYPIFKNFINTHEEFQDFICPISQDICSIPMLAPDGQTYDKEFIDNYFKSLGVGDNDLIESPIRNGTFCKNDLVVNTQYCKDIIEKSQKVYHEIIRLGRENVKANGLEAVNRNTREIMNSLMTQVEYQVWVELKPDVESGNITNDERDAIIAKTVAQWDWKIT